MKNVFGSFLLGEVVSLSSPPLHPLSLFHAPSLGDSRDSLTSSSSEPFSKLQMGNAACLEKQIKQTIQGLTGKARGIGNKGNHQQRN